MNQDRENNEADDEAQIRARRRLPPSSLDICGLTLIAIFLNLVRIGSRSIVLDESVSILYGRSSFRTLLHVLTRDDPNMGLYYVLLNFWVRTFGEREAAVRSLSAVFGALAVAAIYLLGFRLFGRMVGLAAGLLLAFDAFTVQYAQTARSYALLVLLVTLSAYFLVVELELPSKCNRIAYVLTSALAVYAHYFTVYVLVVHFGTVVAMKRRAALREEWLEVAAAILLLCAPEAIFAYRAEATHHQLTWIARPSAKDIVAVLVDFAGGGRVLLTALLAGGCYATVSAVRYRQYWPVGFAAAWLVAPVVLSFAFSFVRPIFFPTYLIICVPALILFGISALSRVRRPVVAAALLAPLVYLSAIQLAGFYWHDKGFPPPEDWRNSTRYVLLRSRPGDGIVFYPPWVNAPFDYYVRRNEASGPANITGHPPAERDRIWLVIRDPNDAGHFFEIRQLQASLTERYRLVDRREFQRVEVQLYMRPM